MSAIRFAFTKIIVDDLDRLDAFYRPVFEMQQLMRMQIDVGGDPMEEIVYSVGGGAPAEPFFALFKFIGRKPPQPGETMLGFMVEDLDGVLLRIATHGGHTVYAPAIYGEGEAASRVGFAADPDGRLIELVESKPA